MWANGRSLAIEFEPEAAVDLQEQNLQGRGLP
jgi:hypothetical protein